MNYEDLTEQQRQNIGEFLKVIMTCDEEQLDAMDHQIPMTPALFERCLDTLISIQAVRQIDSLLKEFPDFAIQCGSEFELPEEDLS